MSTAYDNCCSVIRYCLLKRSNDVWYRTVTKNVTNEVFDGIICRTTTKKQININKCLRANKDYYKYDYVNAIVK